MLKKASEVFLIVYKIGSTISNLPVIYNIFITCLNGIVLFADATGIIKATIFMASVVSCILFCYFYNKDKKSRENYIKSFGGNMEVFHLKDVEGIKSTHNYVCKLEDGLDTQSIEEYNNCQITIKCDEKNGAKGVHVLSLNNSIESIKEIRQVRSELVHLINNNKNIIGFCISKNFFTQEEAKNFVPSNIIIEFDLIKYGKKTERIKIQSITDVNSETANYFADQMGIEQI